MATSNILNQPITSDNILPYAIALTDKQIQNGRNTLYQLKKAKNILPTVASSKASGTTTVSRFGDIPVNQPSQQQMPPLLRNDSTKNFMISERTAEDANTYIQPFNNNIGLMDDPLNMQKYAFGMYMKLQDDKLQNINQQLSEIEAQKANVPVVRGPIKSVKNTATSLTLNVDEYTPAGLSTTNYGLTGLPAVQPIQSNPDLCPPIDNTNSYYYLVYGNNGCLSYDNYSDEYKFGPCNANDTKQQFFINPINTVCDYNNYTSSNRLLTDSSVKLGFNVVTPLTNSTKCVTANADNSITLQPCTLENNQKFQTFGKKIY